MTTATFGRHIGVDDRQLYIEYVDRVRRNGPAVVFEAGAGDSSSIWEQVFSDVASFVRVFRYDRPGLGQSDPVSHARTLRTTCDDLHSILANVAITGPYVLIGHSFGGLAMSWYAYRYPSEVCGLVLIDSSHPDMQAKLGSLLPPKTPDEGESLSSLRQVLLAPEVEFGSERIELAASLAQGHSITSLGDMPLIVLTGRSTFAQMSDIQAELTEQLDCSWQALQGEFLDLSSQSKQIIAKKSGHYIHHDQPHVVIDAIRSVVDQVSSVG